jgi:hypothetical protein
MPSPTPRSGRSRALHARDAGLRRVSIVTRVAIAASVVAAGAFTAIAASAQPGRPKTATPNRPLGGGRATPVTVPPTSSPAQVPGTTPPTLAPDGNGGTNPGDDGLAPPTTLPDPGYSSGPTVVSGAS